MVVNACSPTNDNPLETADVLLLIATTTSSSFSGLVNAVTFIKALPQGFETPLVEQGRNLSQGQRQLLAFARVLAADPEILVLDEATASIDTETELAIQEGLRAITAGRTSIIIAHRLQTIEEADKIIVLQNGCIKEMGTHNELIQKEGLYHTLHALQFKVDS